RQPADRGRAVAQARARRSRRRPRVAAMTGPATAGAIPASSLDPFSDAALRDPWAIYRELRDLGPVFHLTEHDLYPVMRYEDVRAVLGDWETYSSLSVALNPGFNQMASGSVDTNILMASPPAHHRLRAVLGEDLAPRGLREKYEAFVTERADALV